ncbi:hypothetical protein FHW84_003788 [Dyella sp. SG562]|uniref:hypothetical protein n=1 Tax=Dyella sp. SG562 TaxID=2587017 RepID=UPI00141D8F46|nr:hypothetical protein [Dyella sp. SG562]NII75190.1 hypothetical protein [Dyella sp. SG562]
MQFPITDGEESGPRHPVLHCWGVNIAHPSLLGFTVAGYEDDPSPLTVWIPYTHVLGIIEVRVPVPKLIDESDEDGKVVSIGSAMGKSASRQLH